MTFIWSSSHGLVKMSLSQECKMNKKIYSIHKFVFFFLFCWCAFGRDEFCVLIYTHSFPLAPFYDYNYFLFTKDFQDNFIIVDNSEIKIRKDEGNL